MEKPNIISEEIKVLEERLAEKKKELVEAGKEFNHGKAAKEVIREYSSKAPPASIPTPVIDEVEAKEVAKKFADEPHARQVSELLKIASKNGILNAIKVAGHLNNPHLLDDFHDKLVFEFFKEGK